MNVLVTGGSGFLGGWVAQKLTERGHRVRALVRKTSKKAHLESLKGLEFAEGAVEDKDAVFAAAKGVDAIIHSAGIVKARNEGEYVRTNVEGTRNLIEAARHHGGVKRFVHVSSLEASGPSADGGPVPHHQESPVTAYGRSKLAAEKAVLEHKEHVPLTILRPGAIYGPRDQEILEAFKSVQRGLMPIVAGGKARGSFIFGPDCAEACVRALEANVPSGSTYFVDDGSGARTQREFLEMIESALGTKALIRFSLPIGLLKTVSHGVKFFGAVTNSAVMLTPEKANMLLQHFVCESDKTRADLGWKPTVPLEQGLPLTVQWYRENAWL
jgi:2-alkyl-3-oxoalkanoate reductase